MKRIVTLSLWIGLGSMGVQGASENVFVVVNTNSWASKAVANYYVGFRQIPESHVFHLDYRGAVDYINLDEFLKLVLQPVRREVRERGLTDQIDYLLYSADFPYAIDFSARIPPNWVPKDQPREAARFASGSLTGLTFLHSYLGAGVDAFASLTANRYAVQNLSRGRSQGIRQFRGEGLRSETDGLVDYPLSTMLGYAAGRGNSVGEILSYLRGGAIADASHPTGTFYFMRHADTRSRARSPLFETIVQSMRKAGLSAEIVDGQVPPPSSTVAGAVLGSADITWNPDARILPGSICENFTSYGGILGDGAQQTPLTALLRWGAAGSSGTVAEPFAIPQKFPNPAVQVHYVQGCTLAESFYQSVLGPYQLLIVGDALCRPWGINSAVDLAGLPPNGELQGTVRLSTKVSIPANLKLGGIDLFLDGRMLQHLDRAADFEIDSRKYPDGDHLLTAVAYLDSPAAPESRCRVSLWFNNASSRIECQQVASGPVRLGRELQVAVKSPGHERIAVQCQGRTVGTIASAQGTIRLPTTALGIGPVQLRAVAYDASGQTAAVSRPLAVQVLPPAVMAAISPSPLAGTQPGIAVRRADGTTVMVSTMLPRDWLERVHLPVDARFQFQAFVEADHADLFQFRGFHQGTIALRVDGKLVYSGSGTGLRYGVPLHLAKGVHEIQGQVQLQGQPRATFAFGNRGAQDLSESFCRCRPGTLIPFSKVESGDYTVATARRVARRTRTRPDRVR